MTAHRIPFMDLRPGEDADRVAAAIRCVIERGWFVLGPEVEAFEREFAQACGTAHAVGVGTGTDAIALTLKALGIGRGDEVITTPLSAAFTTLAVMMAGARPVFADIDDSRLTLDPEAAAAKINTRTAALLPVHLYGQPADLRALADLARRHNLALIEDCCQSHLATCAGRPVGTFGCAGAFSFYPTKNLGALGDGGAVATNDALLADRIRRLRNGGQTDRCHHVMPGVNSRLDEIQAAILRARLPLLRARTDRRRVLAASYRRALIDAPVAVPLEHDAGHVYHLFAIRCSAREALREHLTACGVETLIHYPLPITRQQALADENPDECPIAERVCGEILSLPLHPGLDIDSIVDVAAAIKSFTPHESLRKRAPGS